MNNKTIDHNIERDFPDLFTIVPDINSGITFYYLIDTSFTLDPFMLTNSACTNGKLRCDFRNINSDIEIRLQMNDDDLGTMIPDGHITLPGDILTEESCVKFFEFNIDIYWEFYTGGFGRDYNSYNRVEIMRRHTIKNIINI